MTTVPDTTGYNNLPNTNYTFTNNFTGPAVPLGAYLNTKDGNTYLSISNTSSVIPISSWTFTPTDSNKYRICTAQLKDTTICLDTLTSSSSSNNSKTTPYLTTSSSASGQSWTLTPWGKGDGTIRLTNDFLGPQLHLDMYNDTKQVYMSDEKDGSGQHWLLTEVETPVNSENRPWEAPSTSPLAKSTPTIGVQQHDKASKAAVNGSGRLAVWVVASLLIGVLFQDVVLLNSNR